MATESSFAGKAWDLYGNEIPMAACPKCNTISQTYLTGCNPTPKEQWKCNNTECPVGNFDASGRMLFRKRRQ